MSSERIALGVIFLIAAYAKLHFAGEWHLRDYQFFLRHGHTRFLQNALPISAVQLMAQVLPWFEFILGAFLIAGIGLRFIGTITSGLLLVFIGAMTRAKILGLEINCGCFGNNEKLGAATLIRDSSLLVLALARDRRSVSHQETSGHKFILIHALPSPVCARMKFPW